MSARRADWLAGAGQQFCCCELQMFDALARGYVVVRFLRRRISFAFSRGPSFVKMASRNGGNRGPRAPLLTYLFARAFVRPLIGNKGIPDGSTIACRPALFGFTVTSNFQAGKHNIPTIYLKKLIISTENPAVPKSSLPKTTSRGS